MSGEIHALNAIFGSDGWSWQLNDPEIVVLTAHSTRCSVRGTLTVHIGVETPSGFRFKHESKRDGIGMSTVETTNAAAGDGALRACRAAVAGALDQCINMFGIDMKTEMKIYTANHQEHKDSRSDVSRSDFLQAPGQSAPAPGPGVPSASSTSSTSASTSRPGSALSASALAPANYASSSAVGPPAGPPLTPVTVTSGVMRREGSSSSSSSAQYNSTAAILEVSTSSGSGSGSGSGGGGEYLYNIAAPAISFVGGPLGTYQHLQPQTQASSMYADAHGRTAGGGLGWNGAHYTAGGNSLHTGPGPGHGGPGPGPGPGQVPAGAGAGGAGAGSSFTGTFKNEPPKMPHTQPDASSAKRARP